ncbi:GyrI-like domain-containing protein [Devosia sp. A449]
MDDKIDFRAELKQLYQPGPRDFVFVDVPTMNFVMVDGQGDPNTAPSYRSAVEWLYSVSYAMKFASKDLGQDYFVPPLEGLWWADDPNDFITRNKANWHWTMMIMAPDFLTRAMYDAALEKAAEKLGDAPANLRLEPYAEGRALQILHLGSYDEEGPALEHLHQVEIPGRQLVPNGHHHEIYLNDPRKTAPAKLKTILRQPVRPA